MSNQILIDIYYTDISVLSVCNYPFKFRYSFIYYEKDEIDKSRIEQIKTSQLLNRRKQTSVYQPIVQQPTNVQQLKQTNQPKKKKLRTNIA